MIILWHIYEASSQTKDRNGRKEVDHEALIAIPDTGHVSSAFFVMPKVSVTRPTPW